MRIVQHKTPQTERPPKDAEDCTGLTVRITLNFEGIKILYPV